MAYKYDISNELKQIQNILVNNSITQNTNTELLNSEKNVKALYVEYKKKMEAVGEKLFNANELLVGPKQVITKSYFDTVFNDVYLDIHALYLSIKYIDDILDINLEKNKKFYSTLEKRIIELENKLDIARLNIDSVTGFDKMYFEGFNNMNEDSYYYNLKLHKKTGELTLKPIDTKTYNNAYQLKSVTSSTFPVVNEDGGVINTTNYLNTFDSSYHLDGQNDMLQNGLWKEQLYVNEIPDMVFDINKFLPNGVTYKYQTQGIVSFIDIEYKYAIDFNFLELDLFGEYQTSIMSIFTRVNEQDPWVAVKYHIKDLTNIHTFDNFTEKSAFNYISFNNLELRQCKFIKIMLNQKNYKLLKSKPSQDESYNAKVFKDLSERRLDVIKLDSASDGKPAVPKTYNYNSFYAELVNIIEYSNNVNDMFKSIVDVLNTNTNIIKTDFNKTLQYEIGTWSIAPKLINYSKHGTYKSSVYKYDETALVSASLLTKQIDVEKGTCNWYLSDNDGTYNAPIIPNDDVFRKEILTVINDPYYNSITDSNGDNMFTTGTLINLDFPIMPGTLPLISIFEDDSLLNYNDLIVTKLNSTLLYIENILEYSKHSYVINYIPSKYDSVAVYTLYNNKKDLNNILEYNIITQRRSILELLIDKLGDNNYTIKRVLCTIDEFKYYFDAGEYNVCVSEEYYNNTKYKHIIDTYLYPRVVNFFKEQELRDVDDNTLMIPSIPLMIERVL